ncbi:MAG TPA: MFS transporter, partial [Promineifilum sp.]|nr:MFS transporter [Promineifilum sp.]
ADVIDVDELNSGERREGLYTGYLVFLRKLGTGVMVFAVGQLLSATGYASSTTGSAFMEQPAAALVVMRALVTALPAIALGLSLLLAWRFPIDRTSHEAVRRALDERRAAREAGATLPSPNP